MSGIVGNNTNRGSGIVKSTAVGADSIDGSNIADDAIDSEHYTDGSIDNAHIADDAIDSEHYAAGSIDEAHIADNAVTLAKMAGGTDGNIISYDASGDPVAIATGSDGQVLTSTGAGSPPAFEAAAGGGVATGFIGGLTISNNASDGDHDIDIAVGSARDYADAETMTQGTAALTKRIDATWAVGDGNGGLDSTDTVGNSTGYGVYLIRRSDTGVVDVLISSDMTSAGSALTMPTSYDQKRLIGWVRTDGSANIVEFTQSGDYFNHIGSNLAYDINDTTITANTLETGTLTSPPKCLAFVSCHATDVTASGPSGTTYHAWLFDGDTLQGVSEDNIWQKQATASSFDGMGKDGFVFTNASSQVLYGMSEIGNASFRVVLRGCYMNTRSNP